MEPVSPPAPEPVEAAPGPPHRPRGFHPTGAGWRTALREFAVIVAGVLTALGAQAWWEGRQERGRERDYLRQLLVDTRENEERIATAIATDSASGHATGRMLAALDPASGPLPPTDTLMEWVGRAGSSSDFRALSGTYTALMSTGDLRLVRNDTLRARLVSYASTVENESQRLSQLRGVLMDQAQPLARAMPFILGAFGDLPRRRPDFEPLRGDREVAVVMFSIRAAGANRLSGLRRMRDETARLRRALEAEPMLRPRR